MVGIAKKLAEHTIKKLTEESSFATREKEMLKHELVRSVARREKYSENSSCRFPLALCLHGCSYQFGRGIPQPSIEDKSFVVQKAFQL
ncbi:hypothetical protein Patl1_25565 [Pistacia atlantica]|uniref:Uncharacterized protein n=1 Tax=Pistacia atlantica TaxID=434234 RepID=A0ACC1B092_9ROSI|nr:hypothetical protein Patl1_25565 [Pistacia atlantica]